MLIEEIKEYLNKWREKCVHGLIGRLNIVKMSIPPKLVYRFNAICTKITVFILVDTDKIILKLIWKAKGLH